MYSLIFFGEISATNSPQNIRGYADNFTVYRLRDRYTEYDESRHA